MRADDAALEVPPEVFDAVHAGTLKADILASAVVDRHVAIAFSVKPGIACQFVGVQFATGQDVRQHNRLEAGAALVRNDLGDDVAVTLQHAHDDRLASGAAHVLALLDAADKRFIDFYGGARATDRRFAVNVGHVLADFMAHAPSGLVGNAKLALQFLRRHAVPRRGEQVHGVEPKLQRRPGLLEWGANCRVQVVTAPLARIGALRLDPEPVRCPLAFGTNVALSKAHIEQVVQAGFVVRKLLEELAGSEGLRHAPLYTRSVLRMQGGYTPNFATSLAVMVVDWPIIG